MKIGVLALQGSVAEHLSSLRKISGITPVLVKKPEDLYEIHGLILPGGESTTMGKLLREFHLLLPLQQAAEEGLPIWGTCAGMILLAKEISNDSVIHLGVMDIKVRRNAFGRQIDSFYTQMLIPEVSPVEIPLVFIRAPLIEEVQPQVQVLAKVKGNVVAARQENLLVSSFHPELTGDLSFHKYFVRMAEKARN